MACPRPLSFTELKKKSDEKAELLAQLKADNDLEKNRRLLAMMGLIDYRSQADALNATVLLYDPSH